MKALVFVLVLFLVGATAVYFLDQQDFEEKKETTVSKETLVLPEVEEAPVIRYPVPEPYITYDEEFIEPESEGEAEPIEKPLPELHKSDNAFKFAIESLLNPKQAKKIFYFRGLVHRFVVTVNSLTEKKLPTKYRLTRPPPAYFRVDVDELGNIYLNPKNYLRYTRYIQVLDALDMEQFVELYVRYYPLIQEAYDELGYQNRYFNDRFIDVIDHLLDTPMIEGKIRLLQPSVYYTFADPELQALSYGQRMLLRIGPDNAAFAKTKLKELRMLLSTLLIDEDLSEPSR